MTKVFRLFGFCSTVLHHSLFIQFFFSFSIDVHLQSTAFSVHFCIGLCWLQCNFRWRMCIQVSTTLWNASDFRSGWSCKFRNQRDQTVWMCSIKFDIARFLCVITLFDVFVCVSVFFLWTRIHIKQTDWISKQALKNQVTLIGMHFITDR